MKFFKFVIFSFLFSFLPFVGSADVTLRTSSGQEVFLTSSQYNQLSQQFANMVFFLNELTYGDVGWSVTSMQDLVDLINKHFYFLTTTITNDVNQGIQDGYYNLSYYSNIYSNQMSRFLSAYTNNLAHQFDALPSKDWLYSYLETYQYSMDADYWKIWNEQDPNYFYNTSWERLINFASNQQFDYVYNSNYNPLWQYTVSGMPYDIQELQRIYVENINLLNDWKYAGYERDNPLAFSNQLIKVNAILKLWEDRQAAYVNKYKSSLLQADNWKNGYVDYQGDFIPWGAVAMGEVPQAITDLISFNPFQMSLNDAFEFATNYLSRLSNPNDEVFGQLDKETKEVYLSNIQKQMSTLADCQTQKQLDNFINGLQDMLNTMSNCCENMSYLPGIYESLTNVIGVGDGNTGGSGNTGGENSTNDYPLGFAPSETNQVSYYRDWQDYNPSIQITQLQIVNDVKYSLERHNTEQHNEKSGQVVSNLTGRIIPIIDKFRVYAQTFSRQSPSRQVHILDCTPIQTFASEHANLDAGLGSDSGFLDTEFLHTNVLTPLHAFFTVIWLLLTALLLISSWVFFVRKFYRFRLLFVKLWQLVKDLFK